MKLRCQSQQWSKSFDFCPSSSDIMIQSQTCNQEISLAEIMDSQQFAMVKKVACGD